MSSLPIKLSGNLGERHRYLNSLVDSAYQTGDFQHIRDFPEHTPIDRLFKIDVASKFKDVDYITATLKDEDMLYVSRALKSMWLLDSAFSNIINPCYLEEKLYPEMTTTAVNKTKHWICLNLTETKRCEGFFEYYSKDFVIAVKFLVNCSNEFVLSKIVDVLDKLTPHHLKVLSEKCPEVAKIYFDSIKSNEKFLSSYLDKETKFYNSLKSILKTNPDIHLDITEKYFNRNRFSKFSSAATKYVMINHKTRYNNKPELYAAWLLDMETLAQYLDTDEIKELVLRLARAEYLGSWFSYKAVEPLIKRLSVEERAAFKQQVFVEKSIGEKIADWPYETPSAPEMKYQERSLFKDSEPDPDEYTDLDNYCLQFERMLQKRRLIGGGGGSGWRPCDISERKSSFDKLFDRYRFINFRKTFSELKTKMTVENQKNRQNMMLVLVSKSGGHTENVEELLKLLIFRHMNEPLNLRATVIRSLVKRSFAWRLPQEIWDLFLKFGKDLGLDGKETTADCREGLHAVVLRNILEDKHNVAVWNAFLENFTTFSEYSLNSDERKVLSKKLPARLLSDTGDVDQTIFQLDLVLKTLTEYKIPFEQCPGAIEAVKSVASLPDAKSFLYRLFLAKIARKELFRENFAVMKQDSSYFNALKHDVSVLESVEAFQKLIESEKLDHDRFIRKLALYFGEENGLAEKYLSVLEKHLEEPHKKLARPLALLGGIKVVSILKKLDSFPKKSPQKRLARVLRSNVHLARPLIDLDNPGWKFFGAKAVANRVITCSIVNVDHNVPKLVHWRRTARLAFVLSMRIKEEHCVLAVIGQKRPKIAIKAAILPERKRTLDLRVWDVILSLIEKLDPTDYRLDKSLHNVKIVPSSLKFDYCLKTFEFFIKKKSKNAVLPIICLIELILPELDEQFVEKVLIHFISNELTTENIFRKDEGDTQRHIIHYTGVSLYMRIIAKFLLLSKTETTQQNRLENIAEPFFKRMGDILKNAQKKSDFLYLYQFLQALQYNKVFFDPNYVSCLPVFEGITKWMNDFLPQEIYFGTYAKVHLTMLYFKSVRQSIKNNPAVFDDMPNNVEDCVSIVGHIFGKYIAHETAELVGKYFESVKEIYKENVASYLGQFSNYVRTRMKNMFIASIIKSIMECESESHVVAVHIIKQMSYVNEDEIFKMLNECKTQELRFFLLADI